MVNLIIYFETRTKMEDKQKQEVENSTKQLAAEKENLSSEVEKLRNETAALNR